MERVKEYLAKKESDGLLRCLTPASSRSDGYISIDGKRYLDFSSNDYLGLSAHPYIKSQAKKAIEDFGVGSSASRLLSGDLELFHSLQESIAHFKSKECALVFNSGYQLNVGVIPSLCSKGDVIFSDKLNHASIIDGILLSGADFFRFKHNDPDHLKSLLKAKRASYKNALIITETVFSMDGDKPPLNDLVKLKAYYNCNIMVDEAHATGIFGLGGSGVVEELGLSKKIDLIMGTFSKALGSFGGYVACSKEMVEYLINSCRSFIYSTALPPSIIAANIAAIELVKKESYRRKQLIENADYFRKKLTSNGYLVKGSSQIVPVIIGDSKEAQKISHKLRDRGHWVLPIRPPTVPSQSARLRFSLTYYHSKDILDGVLNDIFNVYKR